MTPFTSAHKTLIVLAMACASVGCATMKVGVYAANGMDIRHYRTFDWGPADTTSTGDPRLDNNRFFDERVRTQVEKQLAARGLERAAAGIPDFFVHYHASVTQEIDISDLDSLASYCEEEECRPSVYDAGTLFVDLVDPRTNTLIWRGWARGSFDGVIDDQDWMEARIDETIAQILQRLPGRF